LRNDPRNIANRQKQGYLSPKIGPVVAGAAIIGGITDRKRSRGADVAEERPGFALELLGLRGELSGRVQNPLRRGIDLA